VIEKTKSCKNASCSDILYEKMQVGLTKMHKIPVISRFLKAPNKAFFSWVQGLFTVSLCQ
jgi:hypothetical protein